MRFSSLLTLFAAALPMAALAAAPGYHRVELKAAQGKPLPYTLEVPQDWQVRQVAGFPGLWIGPADAKPMEDARMIWVRQAGIRVTAGAGSMPTKRSSQQRVGRRLTRRHLRLRSRVLRRAARWEGQ